MKDCVIIKASASGFILKLDPEAEFEDIRKMTGDKFRTNREFFGSGRKALQFTGRDLSDDEMQDLKNAIETNSDIKIPCILDKSNELVFRNALSVKTSDKTSERPSGNSGRKFAGKLKNNGKQFSDESERKADSPENEGKGVDEEPYSGYSPLEDPFREAVVFQGNLRSGQVVEADMSIVLLGDVNAGAEVISKGNVFIIGSLKGNVSAGRDGSKNAFVIALDMEPIQIRIADMIAKAPDKKKTRKKTREMPKIAYVEDDNIYIDDISREIINQISLDDIVVNSPVEE